jgi:hypothetical protein
MPPLWLCPSGLEGPASPACDRHSAGSVYPSIRMPFASLPAGDITFKALTHIITGKASIQSTVQRIIDHKPSRPGFLITTIHARSPFRASSIPDRQTKCLLLVHGKGCSRPRSGPAELSVPLETRRRRQTKGVTASAWPSTANEKSTEETAGRRT